MPLAGTFDVLDFGEVLSLLSRQSATGRLQVRAASMHGVIWLADGQATAAEISNSSGGETRNKWRNQIEDICFDALRSPRGSFEFHAEDDVHIPPGPRVDLDTVLANGRRRLEMWHEVEAVIHSFEAVPRLAESLSNESLTLSQDRWKVLVAIDGRRNVAALARRLDIELLEFCQLLKPMVESGAVILDQPEGWLKSLPKVRLELDPSLVIDPGSPQENLALVNNGRPREKEAAVTPPGPLSPPAAVVTDRSGPPGSRPNPESATAPAAEDAKDVDADGSGASRWRVRRRTRARPDGPANEG
jgi:hypothetical protein